MIMTLEDGNMSTYTVKYADNTKNGIVINEQERNTDTVDIVLHGRADLYYGQDIDESLLHMLEHFACPETPTSTEENPEPDTSKTNGLLENVTQGQLWYNSTRKNVYYWTGSEWVEFRLYGSVSANWGQILDGNVLPRPVNPRTGYVFKYSECIWSVAPSVIPDGFNYYVCGTDENSLVNFKYMAAGQDSYTSGTVNYLIVGISGNDNSGVIDVTPIPPTPTPTPTRTTEPSPTPTMTLTSTVTMTPTPTVTMTMTPTQTPQVTATQTPIPSRTPDVTSTPAASVTPSVSSTPPAPSVTGLTFNGKTYSELCTLHIGQNPGYASIGLQIKLGSWQIVYACGTSGYTAIDAGTMSSDYVSAKMSITYDASKFTLEDSRVVEGTIDNDAVNITALTDTWIGGSGSTPRSTGSTGLTRESPYVVVVDFYDASGSQVASASCVLDPAIVGSI